MPGFGQHNITQNTHNFLSQIHNKKSNMSMGLIVYCYLKQIKNLEDEIFLVGFTHHMNNNYHNNDGERDFFLKEQEAGLCKMIKLVS